MTTFVGEMGSDLFPTSLAALTAFVHNDAERWIEIVDTARIERK